MTHSTLNMIINNQFAFEYRIMLVDDDDDDQEIFAARMSGFEHNLQVFSSGSAALYHLKNLNRDLQPHLIVLDYQMPGLNGLDILKRLKQQDSLYHIPVVVYSSEMNERLQEKLNYYGAIRCFKKTIDLKEMKEYLQILGIIFEHSVFN
jgi:CheY-like chemotaxis protein